MPRSLFTADTHYGHAGIVKLCQRPWSNVEEMNELLITGWNAVVSPSDTVWHLGDFAHKATAAAMRRVFARLNGIKHLVPGNHDNADTFRLGWKSINPLVETTIEGQRLVLCHYALRTWHGQRRGAINLYGHSHGRLPGTSQSADVGVDCWGYVPVDLAQIRQRLVKQPAPQAESDLEPESGGPTP
jgi:calcineurin-like phosphoesterase family protein